MKILVDTNLLKQREEMIPSHITNCLIVIIKSGLTVPPVGDPIIRVAIVLNKDGPPKKTSTKCFYIKNTFPIFFSGEVCP